MSKPLELTIYPKSVGRHGEAVYVDESGQWTYPVSHVDGYAQDKRFTGSELASECYRQMIRAGFESGLHHRISDGDIETIPGDALTFGPMRRETARLEDVKHFATRPSYDEVS